MKAIWNQQLLAQSSETLVVEGNHYFPPQALNMDYFLASSRQTTCPWKGVAHYYDLRVDGQVNAAAAWFYPAPKPEAQQIAGTVAFWKGVVVCED
jgi:uncharacterized protein (DUF427 family)